MVKIIFGFCCENWKISHWKWINGVCEAIEHPMNEVKCMAHFPEINFHSVLHFSCSNVNANRRVRGTQTHTHMPSVKGSLLHSIHNCLHFYVQTFFLFSSMVLAFTAVWVWCSTWFYYICSSLLIFSPALGQMTQTYSLCPHCVCSCVCVCMYALAHSYKMFCRLTTMA